MEYKGFTFKYYNGEETNPFTGKDENAELWWDGESQFYTAISREDGDMVIRNVTEWYDGALRGGKVFGMLTDLSIPKNVRVLVFWLDLWHGKFYPYEDLDLINNY